MSSSMSPGMNSTTEHSNTDDDKFEKLIAPQASPWKYEIVYPSVVAFGVGHLAAIYGLYLACTVAMWSTIIFQFTILAISGLGVTAGAHRLWTHKAYKAKLPLQIILVIFNSLASQYTVTHWARDHRMHHKYSETDADPHNATRGFFFSHIGWLLVRKHPELKKRKDTVDMSDIYANPVLRFQKKYAIPFIGIIGFLLPTVIPMYFFGETLNTAWHVAIMRYIFSLQASFLVNSAAHLWGGKPYDKTMKSAQNILVAVLSLGEGFHNYHHVYPWDYKTAELGNNILNPTTMFIDFFAWIGWAYDLKSVSSDVIATRAKRTGDGSNLWGIRGSFF